MADNSLGGKVGVPVVVPVITEWESWTPTGSWSTNTTYTGRKRRIGSQGYYEVKIVTAGAPTSAALTINMPSGEVINTTDELIQYASGVLGWGVGRDTGVLPYLLTIGYTSSTVVSCYAVSRPTTYATNSDAATQAIPFTFGASDEIYLRWDVPIVAWAGSASVAYGAGLATSAKAGLVDPYAGTGVVYSSNYTPTTTGGTNTSSTTSGICNYSRNGKMVVVSGQITVNATSGTNTRTQVDVSLPIASNLTAVSDLTGSGSFKQATGTAMAAVHIEGSVANDRAVLEFSAPASGSQTLTFIFQYEIK